MTDLHTRLTAAVTAQLEVARAAAIGWDSAVRIQLNHDLSDAPLADAIVAYFDDNGPADAVRRYVRDLRVLERHVPVHIGGPAAACKHEWADRDGWIEDYPCDDIRDLATAYGVELSP